MFHQRFPRLRRQPVDALLIPGNLLHLEAAIIARVENRPAKQKEERYVALLDPVEKFRRREVQIITARHRQDRLGRAGKGAHRRVRVRPEFPP